MTSGSVEEFLSDMEKGVYNFTDGGKCSSCGECCSNILPLSKDEVKTIARYKRKHHIEEQHAVPGAADGTLDMTCPFRDSARRICTVYKVRPLICRDFKCDKPQRQIEKTREFFYARYRAVDMRETFFGKERK